MFVGWTQVAFRSELESEVSAVDIGNKPLVAVRTDAGMRVFDATCPHRGAHLGYGGRLHDDVIVCAFHGHQVRLGADANARFCVNEYPAITAAEGLFVLLSSECDTGLANQISKLDSTHYVVPGFQMRIAIAPEYVVENAFDADHFPTVHGISRCPRLNVSDEVDGAMRVDGVFDTERPNQWQVDQPADDGGVRTYFSARAYSPYLVIAELGNELSPHIVITAATPEAGGCRVRVTVALPRRSGRPSPTVREVSSILNGSLTAFEQDAVVWEHLDTTAVPRWTESDRVVRAYRSFCQRFQAIDTGVPR